LQLSFQVFSALSMGAGSAAEVAEELSASAKAMRCSGAFSHLLLRCASLRSWMRWALCRFLNAHPLLLRLLSV
tara:strand:+ start:647 stop:865 length:219 start_codon:yes stop_codon:yes gene_type:complete